MVLEVALVGYVAETGLRPVSTEKHREDTEFHKANFDKFLNK